MAPMLLFSILQKSSNSNNGNDDEVEGTQLKLNTFSKRFFHTSFEKLKLHIPCAVHIL
jgi:hypothetical protein